MTFTCTGCNGTGKEAVVRFIGGGPYDFYTQPCQYCRGTGDLRCDVCGVDAAAELIYDQFMCAGCSKGTEETNETRASTP